MTARTLKHQAMSGAVLLLCATRPDAHLASFSRGPTDKCAQSPGSCCASPKPGECLIPFREGEASLPRVLHPASGRDGPASENTRRMPAMLRVQSGTNRPAISLVPVPCAQSNRRPLQDVPPANRATLPLVHRHFRLRLRWYAPSSPTCPSIRFQAGNMHHRLGSRNPHRTSRPIDNNRAGGSADLLDMARTSPTVCN